MENKNSKGLKTLVVILIILVIGLVVYIVCDKCFNKIPAGKPLPEPQDSVIPTEEVDFEGYWLSSNKGLFIISGTNIKLAEYGSDFTQTCDLVEIVNQNDNTYVIKRNNCYYGEEADNNVEDITITYDINNNTFTHNSNTYYLIANNQSEFEDFDEEYLNSGTELNEFIKTHIKSKN